MVGQAPAGAPGEVVKTLLGRLPLFAGLPPDALDELVRHIRTRRFNRGTVIFHKDDPGSLLYMILAGAVAISVPSTEGKDLVLSILSVGDFFGELSLFDEEPRSATAEALEDNTQTLILPREDFLDLVNTYPQMSIHLLALLSRRLRAANVIAQDACLLDLPGRLARRLLELTDKHGRREGDAIRINLRLTQAELASLVGATRVATNRQLQRWQRQGVLEWESQHITVNKPAVLRRLAMV